MRLEINYSQTILYFNLTFIDKIVILMRIWRFDINGFTYMKKKKYIERC